MHLEPGVLGLQRTDTSSAQRCCSQQLLAKAKTRRRNLGQTNESLDRGDTVEGLLQIRVGLPSNKFCRPDFAKKGGRLNITHGKVTAEKTLSPSVGQYKNV